MASDELACRALEAVDQESPQGVAEVLNEMDGNVEDESDAIVLDYLSSWSEKNNYDGLSERADDLASQASNSSYSFKKFAGYGGLATTLNITGYELIDYFIDSEPILSNPDIFSGLLIGGITGVVVSKDFEPYRNSEEFLLKSNSGKDFFPYKENIAEIKNQLRTDYSRNI